eukprot:TRINITY_DN811_c0_g1_i3.p1 TRINITY_DN811_c0_g1~~TRINITY_DN811_c0_g1_i3.p1  ORF type:complete len:329 (+),score=94.84 TRINITY_DN811_c0_g1_i3:17-1003(+)
MFDKDKNTHYSLIDANLSNIEKCDVCQKVNIGPKKCNKCYSKVCLNCRGDKIKCTKKDCTGEFLDYKELEVLINGKKCKCNTCERVMNIGEIKDNNIHCIGRSKGCKQECASSLMIKNHSDNCPQAKHVEEINLYINLLEKEKSDSNQKIKTIQDEKNKMEKEIKKQKSQLEKLKKERALENKKLVSEIEQLKKEKAEIQKQKSEKKNPKKRKPEAKYSFRKEELLQNLFNAKLIKEGGIIFPTKDTESQHAIIIVKDGIALLQKGNDFFKTLEEYGNAVHKQNSKSNGTYYYKPNKAYQIKELKKDCRELLNQQIEIKSPNKKTEKK